MTDGRPATHRDLLHAAARLQEVALTHDDEALHAELCRLRNALVDHVRDEQEHLVALSAASRQVVERGHTRLLAAVDDLLTTSTHDAAECPCHLRVVEVTRLLGQQARAEADMLGPR